MDNNQLHDELLRISKNNNINFDDPTKIDKDNFECFFQDVSDSFVSMQLKKSQAELEHEKLKVVVDNTPCTISWINSKLEYQWVNKSLSELWELPAKEYVGKKVGFLTKESYFYEFSKELFAQPKPTLYRELVSAHEGTTRHFWVVGSKYAGDTEAVIIGIETTELKQAKKKLEISEKLVEMDDLTGLFNMRSMFCKIENEIERVRRFLKPFGVVMMDMDNFKSVNDNHNHLFGSYVLKEVGKIIRRHLRKVDIAARYGGDEFLLLTIQTGAAGMETICERIRQTIEERVFEKDGDRISLTVSIGYSIFFPDMDISAKDLVKLADVALYKAKHDGRNNVKGHLYGDQT